MNSIGKDEDLIGASVTRFVKGSVSGLAAAMLLQPLAVVKTSMQISPIHVSKRYRETRKPPKIQLNYAKFSAIHMSVATGNKVKLLKMESLRPSTKKMNFR
jgi:hypothetical protein